MNVVAPAHSFPPPMLSGGDPRCDASCGPLSRDSLRRQDTANRRSVRNSHQLCLWLLPRASSAFPMKIKPDSAMDGSLRSILLRLRTRLPTGYPHRGRQRAEKGTPPPGPVSRENQRRETGPGVSAQNARDFHGCACTDRRCMRVHIKLGRFLKRMALGA